MNRDTQQYLSGIALEKVKTAAWKADLDTQQFEATKSFFQILNLPILSLNIPFKQFGRIICQILNREQRYSLAAAWQVCLETGNPSVLSYLIKPNGHTKWITLVLSKSDEDEQIIYGTLQDITVQRQLEEQQKFTQQALDKANVMVVRVDSNGAITYSNESVTGHLGFSKKELAAKSIFEIAPNYSAKNWKNIWRQAQKGTTFSGENFLTAKDKVLIPVELETSYARFYGKEFLYIYAKDISIRRKQRQELQSAKARIETLLSQVEQVNIYETPSAPPLQNGFSAIISQNVDYLKTLDKIHSVAKTDTTVLILGETGTGKELLAKAVHQSGDRKDKPMIIVNCAALPHHLIESELFGHERGAFTGAIKRKIGRFEKADGATVFLDEIGELPLPLQSKLLRILQDGTFERIGSHQMLQTNVRIIAATNQNLAELVNEGLFRRDLFYRLNVFTVNNPPLRERRDDIPILVKHFVKKYNEKLGKQVKKLSKSALRKLTQYDFPGNIRELENIIQQAVVLSQNGSLDIKLALPTEEAKQQARNMKSFENMQRTYILKALKLTNWRVSGEYGAAKILDLNPKTLETKMRKLGIRRPK